ncbi:hypothetical protein BH20ACI1_BH20ACI1_08140 [soil metagenome]
MSAFLQMGHDSMNLIGEDDLDSFKGIILSPVNEESYSLSQSVTNIRNRGSYEIVFDPQLYFPRSQRGHLIEYPYFPNDLDTADLSSEFWWSERVNNLADYTLSLGIDSVASPAIFPNTWSESYYALCANTCSELKAKLSDSGTKTLATVMIGFNHIQSKDEAYKIASIMSDANSDGYYVVISADTEPRRELNSEISLTEIMKLISALEGTDKPVLVSHCSSEMLLFKAAGATSCATGKFFNLRRFTQSRYDDDSGGGGGQLAYWFEHSLLAFLRLADVLRIKNSPLNNLIGTSFSKNLWSDRIEENFTLENPPAGIREGWRQYLCWFSKTEEILSENEDKISLVKQWLREAETNWLELEDRGILFDEPRNNGSWIRPWRQSLNNFLS